MAFRGVAATRRRHIYCRNRGRHTPSRYREWGWEIFQAIETRCKTRWGYGSAPDVRQTRQPDDRMESFFLAETIKYLYLLQAPDHGIDLEQYVFNTEAHPLKVLGPGAWASRALGAGGASA